MLLELTQNSKTNYFDNTFMKINQIYSKCKRVLWKLRKKRKTCVTSIQFGNKTIENASEKTSEFNKHFISIAKQI